MPDDTTGDGAEDDREREILSTAAILNPEKLRLVLLGQFAVYVGSHLISDADWHLRRAKSLLQLLALSPGHRLHRERVVDALWPEGRAENAESVTNNLHRVLHTLRRVLQPDASPRSTSPYVALSGDLLILCPSRNLWVDVDAFTLLAATARRTRDPATMARALDLYGGELLPHDTYDDWVGERRKELHECYVSLLTDAVQTHLELGDADAALRLLQMLVAAQPDDEQAHVALMQLYAASHQRYAAVRQYQQLRNILDDLGVDPESATQRLYTDIRAGRLPAASPAFAFDLGAVLASASAPSASYPRLAIPPAEPGGPPPASLDSFIGREREVAAVAALLASSRMLTLGGAGGCGKSRLALEVASRVGARFRDGVTVVELAALANPRLVVHAVAEALGVIEEAERSLVETICQSLRDKQMLLLLDNCEHVRDACTELVDSLLVACPEARILATSRRPLRARDERPWRVPSLTLPDAEQLPPFEELLSYDAVRLFCERARAIVPTFSLTPHNAAAVVAICTRLDGIPLAIELAANRRRYVNTEQIAARLDDALNVLDAGGAQTPKRHQTLRAALDWSYALLADLERILFRRLAVFVGGWTLEAAEAICSAPPLQPAQILGLLSGLVDESLVQVEQQDESTRYRALEPLRQYGREKLAESGEAETAHLAHAQWYATLAGEGDGAFREKSEAEQRDWLHQIDAELANLRAALGWALAQGHADIGLRLAVALEPYWYRRGMLREGSRWLADLLALPGAKPGLRAAATYSASVFALQRADLGDAARLASEGVALCRDLGDQLGMLRTLTVLGGSAELGGDYAHATAYYDQCLHLAREIGDMPRTIISLSNLADVATAQDDLERASELYQECLSLAQRHQRPRLVGMALTNLGKVALRRGEAEEAATYLQGALLVMRGLEEARGIAEVLLPLGHVALARGDDRAALSHYVEALDRYHKAGMQVGIAQSLEAIAHVAVAGRAWPWAARVAAAADALRERARLPATPAERLQIEQTHTRLRAAFTGEPFASAWAEGGVLPLGGIVAEAIAAAREWPQHLPTGAGAGCSTTPAAIETLTKRQRQVVALAAAGLTNSEIGRQLGCSKRTIDKHIERIFKRLRLHSRDDLIAWMNVHASVGVASQPH